MKEIKLPFKKTYKWDAQIWVELPKQLGRERRYFFAKGEKTFEFIELLESNRLRFKMVDLKINVQPTDLVVNRFPDSKLKRQLKVPAVELSGDIFDYKNSIGYVDMKNGYFTLQYSINLSSKIFPILKNYDLENIPVIVQEGGKIDLNEGDFYQSNLRFIIDPNFKTDFQFYCGGGKGSCDTEVHLMIEGLYDPKARESTVYICPGEKITLVWQSSQDVTSANISPDIGNVNPRGTKDVYPTETTTYKIVATGDCKRDSSVKVVVIKEGTTLDIMASPGYKTDYWDYNMSVNSCSRNIVVTSIEPICGVNCAYFPAWNLWCLNCGNYLCHAQWALLKEDPDGHLRSISIVLVRINVPDVPLAGNWRFFAIGTEPPIALASGYGYFRLWLKCNR
jgi:hypothetical protein